MINYDVLRVVQVAGQRRDVGAGELVCAVDGFVFPVCPKDAILERTEEKKKNLIFIQNS